MMQSSKTYDIVIVALFAALMAIGANIGDFIPAVGVPLTFQTFFAILAGALLGSRLGTISMILYTVIGLAGAPFFAKMSGGIGTLFGPTFGFILSFIILAYATGKIIESRSKPSAVRFAIACFVGLIINYVVGTSYMYLALNHWAGAPGTLSYANAWKSMIPFLIKDTIFTVLAITIAPRIYYRVNKARVQSQHNSVA